MLISQLVEINEKGIVAGSVNFDMIYEPEMNLNLCEGFIFNYDPKKPELSTVGILDALRRSYHSRNQPNIHLMVQQYGKGKSHFAVAIANFFKQPFNSLEVQGILHQVEMVTSSSKAVFENLRLYKQNQRQHLVICLSGDRGGDIKTHFLQALLKSLQEQGVENSIAQHTCSEPLRYLQSLDAKQRAIAEQYLKSIGNPDGDLNCLIRLLQENNPNVIPAVNKLAFEITKFIPNFSANLDIEAILKDLLDNLCSGDNPHFQGILILFDELNYYLQSWAVDQFGAGGTALQNITNICENYKGKIALLSFTQIHPSKAVGISATAKDSYLKISSRLAPKDSTYDGPASSLELVLDNLLIQKEDTANWAEFRSRWDNTLLSEARTAYQQRIKVYSQKGWSLDQFYRHLSKGCFPLHPLTAYLLCNLDFTEDRTAIQFIKGYVKNFIQTQPAEQSGQLNYIYPVALVDTFIENFSNYSAYPHYKEAYALVAGSDAPDELTVLKALFLFYSSGEKLTKPDREEHENILASLTGLSKSKLKATLDKLVKIRAIIYYRPETKLYRFFEGINPTGIEEEIEAEIQDIQTSVNSVVIHCQSKLEQYLGNQTITATQFVKDKKLVGADWQFEYKIYSIDGFIRALSSDQTLRGTKKKGILAYVLAETQEELQDLRRSVDEHLSKSSIRSQIAIAIPSEETGDLARVLLKIKTLENKEPTAKRLLGVAYEQLLQRWQEQVNTQLKNLLASCTYHCVAMAKIPLAERLKPQRVISALLQELYLFVPPVDEIDKMRSDHKTGSKIVGFVSKQLFAESLAPQTLPPDSSYSTVIDTVFVSRWSLLKKTSQKYIVQEPVHENIRAAWDLISQMTDLQGLPEKIVDLQKIWQVLSNPPYGHSEYTFTILLAAWLAYHQKEVSLKGISLVKKGILSSVVTQSLKDWATTDVLQKPNIFVSDWIVKGRAKLIRHKKLEPPVLPSSPIDYDLAQQYLAAVAAFLESNELKSVEVGEVTKTRERVITGVEQIDAWFKPVEEAEALSDTATLETLLHLYPQLQHPYTIDLRPDVISIKPTQQQRHRSSHALQAVGEQIQQRVIAKSKRSESLPTEEACAEYKAEVKQIIHQLSQVPSLPPHLSDILRNSLQIADRNSLRIKEQARINQKELQERQKQAQDQQIMEVIDQLIFPKINTVYFYEEAIKEVRDLRAKLNHPEKFTVEIDSILQALKDKVVDFQKKLENLQEQLQKIDSSRQLENVKNEYIKLDWVFKDSTTYPTYQQLQPQICLLEEDLERIYNLENCCQQSNSIACCDDALETISIEQDRLHNLDRFKRRLLQLGEHLRQRKRDYIEQLNELYSKLGSVKTLREAQKLQRELADKSIHYRASQEEERYEAISSEVNLLLNLFQSEKQKLDTLQACGTERERLIQWRDNAQGITNTVQTLLESMLAKLEQTQQQIQKQQKNTAKLWLESLEKQDKQLAQINEPVKRLEDASQLLKEINRQKHQYEEILQVKQKQSLERIIKHCLEIQNQDRESKILVLFQELPRKQRESLLKTLVKYVSGTEEFNG